MFVKYYAYVDAMRIYDIFTNLQSIHTHMHVRIHTHAHTSARAHTLTHTHARTHAYTLSIRMLANISATPLNLKNVISRTKIYVK